MLITFVMKLEEPYEARVSRTVLWEREGEIPSRDPISCHPKSATVPKIKQTDK